MNGIVRGLSILAMVLILAGCATARVVGSGGSSSGDGKIAAGVDIAHF